MRGCWLMTMATRPSAISHRPYIIRHHLANAANIRPRNCSETADRENGLAKKSLSLCLFCD